MLHLTPEALECAYELLRVTRPFSGWRLPPADEVEFHIQRTRKQFADCEIVNGTPIIRVSAAKHAQLGTLLATMAHEMVHLHEFYTLPAKEVRHGATFNKHADRICRLHGFDRGSF